MKLPRAAAIVLLSLTSCATPPVDPSLDPARQEPSPDTRGSQSLRHLDVYEVAPMTEQERNYYGTDRLNRSGGAILFRPLDGEPPDPPVP